MISTNCFGYVKFLFLLFIFYAFIITAYTDNTPESRKEPVHRKPNTKARDSIKADTSTSKIVFESQSSTSATPVASKNTKNKVNDNINSDNKNINKRQQYSQAKPVRQLPNRRDDPKKRAESCPLCDSSVFSYCSDKLLHDACCCLNPFENNLPYQCQYADCSFLHANSCREHHLITSCCCDRYLFQV